MVSGNTRGRYTNEGPRPSCADAHTRATAGVKCVLLLHFVCSTVSSTVVVHQQSLKFIILIETLADMKLNYMFRSLK